MESLPIIYLLILIVLVFYIGITITIVSLRKSTSSKQTPQNMMNHPVSDVLMIDYKNSEIMLKKSMARVIYNWISSGVETNLSGSTFRISDYPSLMHLFFDTGTESEKNRDIKSNLITGFITQIMRETPAAFHVVFQRLYIEDESIDYWVLSRIYEFLYEIEMFVELNLSNDTQERKSTSEKLVKKYLLDHILIDQNEKPVEVKQ